MKRALILAILLLAGVAQAGYLGFPDDGAGGGGGSLNNVVEDITPELGADLDAQTFDITNVGTITADIVTSDSIGTYYAPAYAGADCLIKLQAAIDAAELAGGGIVKPDVSGCTPNVAGAGPFLTIGAGVILEGYGKELEVLSFYDADTDGQTVIEIQGDGAIIRDIKIIGNQGDSDSTLIGFSSNPSGWEISNSTLGWNDAGGGADNEVIIETSGALSGRIISNRLENALVAIHVSNAGDSSRSNAITIGGNKTSGVTNPIYINSSVGNSCTAIWIENNSFDSVGGDGILSDGDFCNIYSSNNWFEGAGPSPHTGQNGIRFTGASSGVLYSDGDTFSENQLYGIVREVAAAAGRQDVLKTSLFGSGISYTAGYASLETPTYGDQIIRDPCGAGETHAADNCGDIIGRHRLTTFMAADGSMPGWQGNRGNEDTLASIYALKEFPFLLEGPMYFFSNAGATGLYATGADTNDCSSWEQACLTWGHAVTICDGATCVFDIESFDLDAASEGFDNGNLQLDLGVDYRPVMHIRSALPGHPFTLNITTAPSVAVFHLSSTTDIFESGGGTVVAQDMIFDMNRNGTTGVVIGDSGVRFVGLNLHFLDAESTSGAFQCKQNSECICLNCSFEHTNVDQTAGAGNDSNTTAIGLVNMPRVTWISRKGITMVNPEDTNDDLVRLNADDLVQGSGDCQATADCVEDPSLTMIGSHLLTTETSNSVSAIQAIYDSSSSAVAIAKAAIAKTHIHGVSNGILIQSASGSAGNHRFDYRIYQSTFGEMSDSAVRWFPVASADASNAANVLMAAFNVYRIGGGVHLFDHGINAFGAGVWRSWSSIVRNYAGAKAGFFTNYNSTPTGPINNATVALFRADIDADSWTTLDDYFVNGITEDNLDQFNGRCTDPELACDAAACTAADVGCGCCTGAGVGATCTGITTRRCITDRDAAAFGAMAEGDEYELPVYAGLPNWLFCKAQDLEYLDLGLPGQNYGAY